MWHFTFKKSQKVQIKFTSHLSTTIEICIIFHQPRFDGPFVCFFAARCDCQNEARFPPKSRLRAVNGSIEGNEICLKSWHHGNHWESKGNYPQNGPPDPGNKALIGGGGGIGRVLNSHGIN